MANEQQRHDMSDKVWNLLEPHLSGQRGQWGGICRRVTGNGVRCINGFADGETKALEKNCWKFW